MIQYTSTIVNNPEHTIQEDILDETVNSNNNNQEDDDINNAPNILPDDEALEEIENTMDIDGSFPEEKNEEIVEPDFYQSEDNQSKLTDEEVDTAEEDESEILAEDEDILEKENMLCYIARYVGKSRV